MNHRLKDLMCAAISALALAGSATPAAGQSGSSGAQRPPQASRPAPPLQASRPAAKPKGKWELDVHGGLISGSSPSGGVGTMPDPGASFVTFNGFQSRQISSWYFGDGALLFNQFNVAIGTPSIKITPLDPALNASSTQRKTGAGIGMRLSRALTDRLSAEFGFDVNLGRMALTSNAVSTIQSSQNSFKLAWQQGLGGFTGFTDSSTRVTVDNQGRQILLTGAVCFDLRGKGSVRPYVTAGVGLSMDSGEDRVALAGNYQFMSLGGVAPKNESDTVGVRYTTGKSFVTVLGGGLKHNLSSRSGIRVDLRMFLSKDPARTFVSATPVVVAGSPSSVLIFSATPALQFSTVAGFNSSLSGPAIANFQTFTGGALRLQVAATFGYFRRF